jgi:hypothetical protein
MFKTELNYFINHQDELVRLYRDKFLVLKGEGVVGAYSSALEAYLEAQKSHPLGTFMIQQCTPGSEAYTVSVATQDLFA